MASVLECTYFILKRSSLKITSSLFNVDTENEPNIDNDDDFEYDTGDEYEDEVMELIEMALV